MCLWYDRKYGREMNYDWKFVKIWSNKYYKCLAKHSNIFRFHSNLANLESIFAECAGFATYLILINCLWKKLDHLIGDKHKQKRKQTQFISKFSYKNNSNRKEYVTLFQQVTLMMHLSNYTKSNNRFISKSSKQAGRQAGRHE